MSEHALFAPSSAYRWAGQCAASVQMEAAATPYPNAEHDLAAAEGNAFHWAAAQIIHGLGVLIGAGSVAPNGIVVDDEMLEAADVYVSDVTRICGGRLELHLEELINVPRVHAQNWGRPDLWAIEPLPDGAVVVHLWDAKYGHRFVDVFENWQLLNYAIGILDHPALKELTVPHDRITFDFRVVQPRSYHREGPVRDWSLLASRLPSYVSVFKGAVLEAQGITPTAKVGPACRDCKARHGCELLQHEANAAADLARSTVNLELAAGPLGVELRYLHRAQALLAARVNGLETQALALIRQGQSVTGYAIEQTVGREKWTVPPETLFATADAMGVDVRHAAEAITPAQARKKGLAESVVSALSSRPGGATKLAQADTTRARKVFSNG